MKVRHPRLHIGTAGVLGKLFSFRVLSYQFVVSLDFLEFLEFYYKWLTFLSLRYYVTTLVVSLDSDLGMIVGLVNLDSDLGMIVNLD